MKNKTLSPLPLLQNADAIVRVCVCVCVLSFSSNRGIRLLRQRRPLPVCFPNTTESSSPLCADKAKRLYRRESPCHRSIDMCHMSNVCMNEGEVETTYEEEKKKSNMGH